MWSHGIPPVPFSSHRRSGKIAVKPPLNLLGRFTGRTENPCGSSVFRSPVLDSFLQKHILDLHQAGGGGPVILVQLHGDIPDGLLCLGNDYIFQGVHPAAGLFNLFCHKLGGLFDLGQLEHRLEHLAQSGHGAVQLTGGGGKAIGEDIPASSVRVL